MHQAERSKERSEEAEICYVFNLRVQLQPFGLTVIGLGFGRSPLFDGSSLIARDVWLPVQAAGGHGSGLAQAWTATVPALCDDVRAVG